MRVAAGTGSVTSRSLLLARLPGMRREPFERVVERFGPMVLRVCSAVVGPAAAEDAWSETFLAALRGYPRLRPGSSVEAWLVTIAHRKAIDQARAAARGPVPAGGLDDLAGPAGPAGPAGSDGIPGGRESELWADLRALPLRQRECVAYHYLAGLPYAEIAAIVGGSAAAARRAAADGIAALRRTYLTAATTGGTHMITTPHGMLAGGPLAIGPGATATAAEERAIVRLRERLAGEAAAAGILDVAYRTVDTPVGSLLLAATPGGLVRVAYPAEDHDRVLDQLASRVSPRVLRAPARLDRAARQLEEYFAGRRTSFDVPLDMRLASGFRLAVLTRLTAIGYGTTASYAAVAAAAGRPRAVRAVGSACAANPLPVVVPCHRVIRSDGTLGGYAGGTDVKRTLLELEAAA